MQLPCISTGAGGLLKKVLHSPCCTSIFFSQLWCRSDKWFLFCTKEYTLGSLLSLGGWPLCNKIEKWDAAVTKFDLLLRGYLSYVVSAICKSLQVANPLGVLTWIPLMDNTSLWWTPWPYWGASLRALLRIIATSMLKKMSWIIILLVKGMGYVTIIFLILAAHVVSLLTYSLSAGLCILWIPFRNKQKKSLFLK